MLDDVQAEVVLVVEVGDLAGEIDKVPHDGGGRLRGGEMLDEDLAGGGAGGAAGLLVHVHGGVIAGLAGFFTGVVLHDLGDVAGHEQREILREAVLADAAADFRAGSLPGGTEAGKLALHAAEIADADDIRAGLVGGPLHHPEGEAAGRTGDEGDD